MREKERRAHAEMRAEKRKAETKSVVRDKKKCMQEKERNKKEGRTRNKTNGTEKIRGHKSSKNRRCVQ